MRAGIEGHPADGESAEREWRGIDCEFIEGELPQRLAGLVDLGRGPVFAEGDQSQRAWKQHQQSAVGLDGTGRADRLLIARRLVGPSRLVGFASKA